MLDESDHLVTVNGKRYLTVELAMQRWSRKRSTIEAWIREDRIARQYVLGKWWVLEADMQAAFRKRVQSERLKRLIRRHAR